jgi:site-specific DNA-methyltransferase (cytosine-N4-specific)
LNVVNVPLREDTSIALQREVDSENWNYAEANTQQLTHGLHRYSGKFIPQIAARAIQLLSDPGDLVLDPYCGSGTTLLEAALLQRRAIGVDLNPLASLIARAKVSPIAETDLHDAERLLREAVEACASGHQGNLFGLSSFQTNLLQKASLDSRASNPWFKKWFQDHVLADLLVLRNAIDSIAEESARSLALVAFSEILRRSSNAHSSYPNVMFDRDAPHRARPGPALLAAYARAVEMVSSLAEAGGLWDAVQVLLGDARALPLEDETVDAVVTHPPYVGSVPYAEYGALSLMWLGVEPKDLDARLTGGRRQGKDVVARFREDYGKMISESHRVLKPCRTMFVMVGRPTVKRQLVDLVEMTIELASSTGFSVAACTTRQGINRRANKLGEEALLFFKKAQRSYNPSPRPRAHASGA